MQYFVIWHDGNKFGPADISQLNVWAAENRINPDTELESVADGARIKARDLPGIVFPSAAPLTPDPSTVSPQPEGPVAQTPISHAETATTSPAAQTANPSQYFVIGTGGQKYGPADVPTLTQWASENRLSPTTMLEDSTTGVQAPASQVPGIVFPVAAAGAGYAAPATSETSSPYGGQPSAPYGAGQTSNYPRDFGSSNPDEGKTEAIVSFVLSGVGFFCCPCVFHIIAIVLGSMAMKKGHPLGKTAIIVAVIAFILAIIFNMVMVFNNPDFADLLQGNF